MADDDLPQSFKGRQVPESVRARIRAAQLLQQVGAQQERPYTSGGVTALKAISGLMGGVQERQAIDGEQQAQAAHRQLLAQLLMQSASPSAVGAAAAAPTFGAAASSSAATSPGLGIPTSAAAGRGSNPAGYDPKATEALIRARAPAYGIDPDTAVAIARSEGLNAYHGDAGSSFGPFQLHYGGVARGGNAVGGLGDAFTKQTGLDARDPSTVPQQIDFSLSQAAKGGWEPWHGRKTPGVNIGVWDGIGQVPKTGAGQLAAVPGSDAVPKAGGGNPDPGLVAAAPAATATLAGGQGSDALGAPSPFGAPPSPVASPTGADPKALAAALRASVPGALTPGSDTVQPPVIPDPQGSLTAPSPFGAGPSPMAAPSPSRIARRWLQRSGSRRHSRPRPRPCRRLPRRIRPAVCLRTACRWRLLAVVIRPPSPAWPRLLPRSRRRPCRLMARWGSTTSTRPRTRTGRRPSRNRALAPQASRVRLTTVRPPRRSTGTCRAHRHTSAVPWASARVRPTRPRRPRPCWPRPSSSPPGPRRLPRWHPRHPRPW